ncbi:MAG: response regulator [Alphaproteobacteria bacterium]|nr:response regulator [Alphaproteobacteria bacterium]
METKDRILLVEDNDFVRMQLARFLNAEGYETIESGDGEEALRILEEKVGEVSLAIVDVRMEPVGGFEFVRMMHDARMNLPVILVTGDDHPDLLNEAGKCGIGTILKKPVQKDRLIKSVFRILNVEKR